MKRSILAVVLVVAIALVLPSVVIAQDQFGSGGNQNRGLSVSGEAEVRAAPDLAYITVGVRTRARDAKQAAADNAAAMTKVMAALKSAGIRDKDVETVQYSIQQAYEYPPNATPRLVGYDAVNLVRVTVRDVNRVGTVIDAVVPVGSNAVQDIAFGLSDEVEARVRAEALTKAVGVARAKASVMASALGVKLGRILSASESVPSIISPKYAQAEMRMAAETPISPREIVVRATANIVYQIL